MNGQYTPLFLAISIPTIVGIVGLILNRTDYNSIRTELSAIRDRLTSLEVRIAVVETRLGVIENLLGIPVSSQKKP